MAPRKVRNRISPLLPTLHDQKRAAYREAILDAAERIFVRDGYQAAKMVEIAQATGVSVGTLYNYFDSKHSVFVALDVRHRERYFQLLEASCALGSPLDELRTIVERTLSFVEQNRALVIMYFQHVVRLEPRGESDDGPRLDPRPERLRLATLISECLERGAKQGLIRSDIEIADLTFSLQSVIHATVLGWIENPPRPRLAHRADQIVKLFLEGASTP